MLRSDPDCLAKLKTGSRHSPPNDPFDGLLVAQEVAEPLRLVTANAVLARYGELVVVV